MVGLQAHAKVQVCNPSCALCGALEENGLHQAMIVAHSTAFLSLAVARSFCQCKMLDPLCGEQGNLFTIATSPFLFVKALYQVGVRG